MAVGHQELYMAGLQPPARRFRGPRAFTIPDPLRGSCFSYILAYNSWSSTRIFCLSIQLFYSSLPSARVIFLFCSS